MTRLGIPHVIFSILAALFFAAMGVMSLPFPPTAQWFPLYVSVLGTILALAAVVVSVVSVMRTRREAPVLAEAGAPTSDTPVDPIAVGTQDLLEETPHTEVQEALIHADEDEGPRATLRGFAWLGLWLAFVLVGLAVGYVTASVIWIGVWFRTAHKWKWSLLIPVLIGMIVLLLVAQIQLNISMPGIDWIHQIFRW